MALIAAALVAPVALADGPAAGVVTPGWIEGAPLPAPRNLATATVLANGKVLIAGGRRGVLQRPAAVVLRAL